MWGKCLKIFRLILIPLVLISCFACSEKTTVSDLGRQSDGLIGIVNDSLAVFASRHCKITTKTYIVSSAEKNCSDFGIHLLNYRRESPIIWEGFDKKGWHRISQIDDSLFGFDRDGEIGLWKIGEEPVVYDFEEYRCDGYKVIPKIKRWRNDSLIIGFHGNDDFYYTNKTCKYMVVSEIYSLKSLGYEFNDTASLGSCRDYKAYGEDIYCLRSDSCGVDILINGQLQDSIRINDCSVGGTYPSFYGDYILTEKPNYLVEFPLYIMKFDFERNVVDREFPFVETDFSSFKNGVSIIDLEEIIEGSRE